MKKSFFIFAIFAMLAVTGCGNSDSDNSTTTDIPNGIIAVDLSKYEIPILINIPDSTIGLLEITANAQGGVNINVGNNFNIIIIEGEGNMKMKKNDIVNDAVRKFVRYVIEDTNAILWEWQIEGQEAEFHFYSIVKVGNKSFEVSNVEGGFFSEKSAIQMLDASKSIRLKEKT
ncbi:MAG: hypothetical protein V1781_07370 [Bacteroidota bacterium]